MGHGSRNPKKGPFITQANFWLKMLRQTFVYLRAEVKYGTKDIKQQ